MRSYCDTEHGLQRPLPGLVFWLRFGILPVSSWLTIGIVIFILLPVASVLFMFATFLRERDHTYTALAAFVLAIIAACVMAGL